MLAVLLVLLAVVLVVAALEGRREPFGAASTGRAMVIVEPRRHKLLPYVLANFDRNVDPAYTLYIFHGTTNGAFARDAARHVTRRPVHFVGMNTENLTAGQYNELLTSRRFYDRVDAEHILVFQTDTVMCRDSPFDLGAFEKYGYVGCAYDNRVGRNTYWGKDAFYGVGGLSMRRKSSSLDCIAKEAPDDVPEDVFFSNCVADGYGLKPEDATVLQRFCSQSTFHNNSLGVHKPTEMGTRDLPALVDYCPEAAALLS